MSVNFPTNRQEAGLSPGGALIQGDIWRYHSIEYTWVVAPDSTGYWSSKGININPDLYIAKTEVFEANGGTISGNYAGTSPFAVGHATSSDSATALETARTIGGVSFDGTSNINLPGVNSAGNQNTTGNAATATSADRVDHSLTLTFVDVNNNSTSIVYDGSSAKSMTFADTDVAQDVITITGGAGIDVTGTTVAIANNVARATLQENDYARKGDGSFFKVKNADSVGGFPASDFLKTDNTTLAKAQTAPPSTLGGKYVVDSVGNGLKALQADRASKDESGIDLINIDELNAKFNAIDTGSDIEGSGRIHCDIRNYSTDTQTSWDLAFSNCMAANGAVYLPAATYNFDGTVGQTSASANVYGDGSGQTILNFASGGGLTFTALRQPVIADNPNLTDYDTVILKGFSVYGPKTGTGINIQYTSSGNAAQKVYCEDVTVLDFNTGWNLVDTDLSTYNHCSALRCTTGVNCKSDNDSNKGDAVNIRFTNWQIGDCITGININTRAEGVYVTDTLIIAGSTGVIFKGNTGNTAAAEPYFVLRGCNIDVNSNCLTLDAAIQSSITDNSFYKRPGNSNWTGVIIKGNSYDNLVTDNIFNGIQNQNTRVGIDVQTSQHTTFSNNNFQTINTAFKLSEDAALNNYIDNDFRVVGSQFNSITPTKHIEKGNLVSQKDEINRYDIINGDGVYIYDALNTGGFKLTSGGSGGNNTGGGDYTLPVATANLLGGIKVGSGLDIDTNSTLSVNLGVGSGTYPGNVINVEEMAGANFSARLLAAFNLATSPNTSRTCVYLPPGTYNMSSDVTLRSLDNGKQISFYGDAFNGAKINTNGHTIRFSQPANVQNLAFNVTGSVVGLLFKRTWSGHEEDMDSTIHNCDFNCNNTLPNGDPADNALAQTSVAVQYWGRNLKFTNNRMKTAKNSRAGLQLLYYSSGSPSGISTTKGFRRTCITNNTFHSFENSTGVLVGHTVGGPAAGSTVSNYPLIGLVFANNTIDFEGTLFASYISLQGGTFTGNSCFWGNCDSHNGSEYYIYISSGNGVVITGNSFDGESTTASARPDDHIFISGSNNIIANNSKINF